MEMKILFAKPTLIMGYVEFGCAANGSPESYSIVL